jgi:hypothetical protein
MGVTGADTAGGRISSIRNRPLSELWPPAALAAGLVLGLAALIRYDVSGYDHAMLLLWLGALAILSLFFWTRSKTWPRIARIDLAIPAGLAIVFAPFYLFAISRWPVQMNSDEVVLMTVNKDYGSARGVDPFGISNYLGRPTGLFYVWGNMLEALGGVTLFNAKLLHAVFGLITIAASYALFRQLLPRWWAALAAVFLGVNHAFLMISRMAMRENSSVLVEVVALALLLWGLRNDHELATFLGGFVAAVGFYVYVPGRAVFPVWALFLVLCGFLLRDRFPVRQLGRLGAIALAGFVLMAGPVMIAESKIPSSASPQNDVLMIYPQARDLQKNWVFADSVWDGWKTNIGHGLTVFNNNIGDNAWIYDHPGHGFVDPVTGILVWLGVVVVGLGFLRRRREDVPLLMLSGFLAVWLSFAFLVNKAPSYPRLLIIIPFVAYFVVQAIRWVADRWRPVRYGPAAVVAGLAAVMVVWNLAIGWDFIRTGREAGDPIGSTARYVESRNKILGEHFFFAEQSTAENLRYYEWGDPTYRIRVFAKDDPIGATIADPVSLRSLQQLGPFTLLMRRDMWMQAATDLADHYPKGRLRNVTPDGTRVALEVPAG